MKVKLYLNYGYCFVKAVVANGDKGKYQIPCIFAIINQLKLGWILFDTGYTNRFYEETKRHLNKYTQILLKL